MTPRQKEKNSKKKKNQKAKKERKNTREKTHKKAIDQHTKAKNTSKNPNG